MVNDRRVSPNTVEQRPGFANASVFGRPPCRQWFRARPRNGMRLATRGGDSPLSSFLSFFTSSSVGSYEIKTGSFRQWKRALESASAKKICAHDRIMVMIVGSKNCVGLAMQVEENIPDHLRPSLKAALNWINQSHDEHYELTGLVDSESVRDTSEPFELGMVLCDGEICTREQVKFLPNESGFDFELVQSASPEIPPLLDPPRGLRARWIDEQFEKFDFIVLLYYRGLW